MNSFNLKKVGREEKKREKMGLCIRNNLPTPLSRGLRRLWFHFHLGCSGARFSKVPIINGPGKLSPSTSLLIATNLHPVYACANTPLPPFPHTHTHHSFPVTPETLVSFRVFMRLTLACETK